MSNTDNSNLESGGGLPSGTGMFGGTGKTPPARRGRKVLMTVGILVFGAAIGAGGLAFAAMMPENSGWRDNARLAVMQHFAVRALDSVGATSVQEAKIHDIIAQTFTDAGQNGDQHAAVRKQALDLLRAPVIDAAAVEKLRAGQIAKMDTASKKIAGALIDAANQLTPEQRTKLASRFEEMAQHGPWGAHHGGPDHLPFDRDHHPDFEQNHGSDGQPDKG